MLRIRPVHFTSTIDEFAAELQAQGLHCVENHGNWRVFDSGNGKVGVVKDKTPVAPVGRAA